MNTRFVPVPCVHQAAVEQATGSNRLCLLACREHDVPVWREQRVVDIRLERVQDQSPCRLLEIPHPDGVVARRDEPAAVIEDDQVLDQEVVAGQLPQQVACLQVRSSTRIRGAEDIACAGQKRSAIRGEGSAFGVLAFADVERVHPLAGSVEHHDLFGIQRAGQQQPVIRRVYDAGDLVCEAGRGDRVKALFQTPSTQLSGSAVALPGSELAAICGESKRRDLATLGTYGWQRLPRLHLPGQQVAAPIAGNEEPAVR